MWAFKLIRVEDETGVSGTGHIADGVEFEDGCCVLRWRTDLKSTAVYESGAVMEKIHGHGGKTRIHWMPVLEQHKEPFERGRMDWIQDRCEGVPLASIGGDTESPGYPDHINQVQSEAYIRGYLTADGEVPK